MIEWILDNWWWLLAGICLWVFVLVIFHIFLRSYKYRCYYCKSSGDIFLRDKSSIPVPDVKKPEWYNILKDELARLPIGNIMFNPPDTIELGVKERIETRVSQDPKANLILSLGTGTK